MREMTWLGRDILNALVAQAQVAPRRRRNLNFHARDDAPCHRLLNAVEPDSYIVPHRHLEPDKDETLIVLAGELGVVTFDDAGSITAAKILKPGGEPFGVTIPAGQFHTPIAMAPGSVIFEAKAGPYRALTELERASWAPPEGHTDAAGYLERLRGRL